MESELAFIALLLFYIAAILSKLYDFFWNKEWDKNHPDIED